ncbi:MAG: 1,4-dihydroxy-2-naphthoate octaprenyltransferase, partial [Actinomycetota bacterium]
GESARPGALPPHSQSGGAVWWRVVPALLVSLALQVGVNYANDYSDGIRGTDASQRPPARLVRAAGATGLVLAAVTTWWLLVVGAAAIASAWFYTGGPRPYGYAGLGELFVFVFFGLVATAGTGYVVAESVTSTMLVSGSAAGCFACALLVINNLRDIPGDTLAGKRTLAVRLGDRTTRGLFVSLFLAAGVLVVVSAALHGPAALTGLAGVAAAWPAIRAVRSGATGRTLVPVLGDVGRAQLVFGVAYAAGLVMAAA